MMLKVFIYAYSLGIYSSRRIAQELKTDTAFIFLSGLQAPDFRTICLFRSQHAGILPDLFVEVVRLCASVGLTGQKEELSPWLSALLFSPSLFKILAAK